MYTKYLVTFSYTVQGKPFVNTSKFTTSQDELQIIETNLHHYLVNDCNYDNVQIINIQKEKFINNFTLPNYRKDELAI